MTNRLFARRTAALSFLAGSLLAMPIASHAENHALILWIGEYANPNANLPGIDLDAKAARQIAHAMGVPDPNVTELKNEQLTLAGLNKAFNDLTNRIKPDDKVFIYYSGHGSQRPPLSGTTRKCSEGMVAHDVQIYFDQELEKALSALGSKASQVVMMNDSCFSGGASQKGLHPKLVAKAYPGVVGAGGPASAGAKPATPPVCGNATNKDLLTKNIEVVRRRGAQLLYIAAAGDTEVSYATPEGSLATQAWLACVTQRGADKDSSGSINGEELRACAQAHIDANKEHVTQHIALTGTTTLPVFFSATEPASAGAPVSAGLAMQDMRAGADASDAYKVTLSASKKKLHIGQDFFNFTVETKREGYLYILQVGSDGKTINLLFPNSIDANNLLPAGKHDFPRESWAMRSAGPAGTNHLLAVLSSQPKDFSTLMGRMGPFASAPATRGNTKNIVAVALGATPGGNGRYGASNVVSIEEAP